jgi:hypothetical protein
VQSVSAELGRDMKLARAEGTQVSASLLCGSAELDQIDCNMQLCEDSYDCSHLLTAIPQRDYGSGSSCPL